MAIKYELKVPTGTYQKEGQTKTSWLRVGAIFEKEGKFSMKIDCMPTAVIDREGNTTAWNGWVQMFEPRPRDEAPAAPQTADSFDDDVPF